MMGWLVGYTLEPQTPNPKSAPAVVAPARAGRTIAAAAAAVQGSGQERPQALHQLLQLCILCRLHVSPQLLLINMFICKLHNAVFCKLRQNP